MSISTVVKKFPLLNAKETQTLKGSLNFLHVSELKVLCDHLSLIDKGMKGALINRIMHYVQTGDLIKEPKIPDVSRAKRGVEYPLKTNTLILKGAYKNDLQTRLFFKKLIGEHFHFTAFGIDWLNERWLKGEPPTYREFADMWQAEAARRQQDKAPPKAEWAYINFTQQYIQKHPKATRQEIVVHWEIERQKHVKTVNVIIQRIS